MASYTDAQLRVLASDVQTAAIAERSAMQTLAAAKVALAAALGPSGSMIISGRQITANGDATDIVVTPVRVVT